MPNVPHHKCQRCGKKTAHVYAQVIEGETMYYRPGFHIRGFPTERICFDCQDKAQRSREYLDAQGITPAQYPF